MGIQDLYINFQIPNGQVDNTIAVMGFTGGANRFSGRFLNPIAKSLASNTVCSKSSKYLNQAFIKIIHLPNIYIIQITYVSCPQQDDSTTLLHACCKFELLNTKSADQLPECHNADVVTKE